LGISAWALCADPFASTAPGLRREALLECGESEAQHRFGQRRGAAGSNYQGLLGWRGAAKAVSSDATGLQNARATSSAFDCLWVPLFLTRLNSPPSISGCNFCLHRAADMSSMATVFR
jgi:hypothetical protein